MTLPFPDHTFGAFLFDMDGTILSSIAAAERVWATWAQKHGLDVETFLPTIHGVRAVETIRRLNLPGIDVMAEVEALTEAEFQDVEGIEAISGAAAFLNELPPLRWAIVTSSPRRLAIRRLEATGLPIPPLMITGEDVANGKPEPDCFLLAAERLGLNPQDCLVFEDAPAGIQAAEAAGTKVVVITATHKHTVETTHPTIAGYGSLTPLLAEGGRLVLTKSGPTTSAIAGA
ncbi:HAD family hydrolase [Mesorhizobium sp. 1M-11]|uniref:HAD family hydrolase n=1 Tax=Mesorhizobium sp. 1M-11 TaxID=1529006 RepID=UPI0006C7601C|nr:HAD family hydrolase [Mesorhizobium sp. 1M-11]